MGELGRILFERRSPRAHIAAFWIVALLFVAGGVDAFGNPAYVYVAPVIVLVGVLMLVGALAATVSRDVFHEKGLRHTTPLGCREIAYFDLKSFTFDAKRMTAAGLPLATQYLLMFEPRPELKQKPIVVALSFDGVQEGLHAVRDRASEEIARRLEAELRERGQVRWTGILSILAGEIEYVPSGLTGRGEPVRVRFADVDRMDVEDGEFRLWRRGQGDPVIRESDRESNFYPGLSLLRKLTRPAA